MKIAHVTATFPPYYSGTGMVCYHNARGLAELGHEVTVLTADYPTGQTASPPGVTVRRLPVAFRFGNAPFLLDLLRIGGYDVIHLHHPFIFGAEMISAAARRVGIPYVLTHHNDLIGTGLRQQLFRLYTRVSSRTIFGHASRLCAVSLDHANHCQLAPLFAQHRSKVVEAPNGVDAQHFRPDVESGFVREQIGIAPGAPIVLFVAALDVAHHFKGATLFLDAAARFLKGNNAEADAHFVLIGDGDLKDSLIQRAHTLGIGDRTHFLGNIPNPQLPPYYAAADVTVLPSSPPESFGMVLIESMACGTPVIASDIAGVRSVVSDGRDGFLMRHGDGDDLVVQLQKMLGDAKLRHTMGLAGRAKVERKYAWEQVYTKLSAMYQEIQRT